MQSNYVKGKIMIRKAAEFAAKAHEGTFRKGNQVPYIHHPMEVALIVAQMTDDEEVIAAAYLHDVLEDTTVSEQELQAQFGARVLKLVAAETENKTLSWKERKETTIRHLQAAPREVKLLTLADKLSNMRSTSQDYLAMGEEVWQKFNEKEKRSHQWYILGIIEVLQEFEDSLAYQELKSLYELVFKEKE